MTVPEMIHCDDFEAQVAEPFDGAVMSDIIRQHGIQYTLRMYEPGKLEPAIEDGRRMYGWELKDIAVIHSLTIPESSLSGGFKSLGVKAIMIVHNITIKDLISLVQRSLKMKAFL
jgi:hypothetical protein